MGIVRAMLSYFNKDRQRLQDEQAMVKKAIAFQTVKSEVIRNQLTKEMRGLHSVESRMFEAFAGLQAQAGRGKQGFKQ